MKVKKLKDYIPKPYKALFEIIAKYWSIYGGWGAFIKSPYLHLSVVLAMMSAQVWIFHEWWERPLSVLPSVLGFSLGGYAIWLALGDQSFRRVIIGRRAIEKDGDICSELSDSPYMGVSAAFAHFVTVQLVTLLYATVGASLYFVPEEGGVLSWLVSFKLFFFFKMMGAFIGYWLFIYSLLVALAATFAIFRVTSWHDDFYTNENLAKAKADNAKEK